MKILRFVRAMCSDAFYRWAMREIHPLHPDVPRIIRRQAELRDVLANIYHR